MADSAYKGFRVSLATAEGLGAGTPSDRPALSVITVAWNGVGMLRRHLGALAKCRVDMRDPIEVIVVDNASSDGTPEMVEREFPWATLIRNGDNAGFACGCNQGIEQARGEYLLLLNPDCEATAPALTTMVDFLHRFPGVGAVGCRLVHEDGTPQRSAYREHTPWRYIGYGSAVSPLLQRLKAVWRNARKGLGVPVDAWLALEAPRACDWLMGACLLVPRRVLDRVGPLDPAFFMYSEDADWCRRIRAAGFAVYYLPGPAMLHRQKQSSALCREFTYVRLYRSLLAYCLRHMRSDQVVSMRRMVLADMAVRRVIFAILLALAGGDRKEAHRERLRATRRVAAIWRRMDPDFDPDPAPRSPRGTEGGGTP